MKKSVYEKVYEKNNKIFRKNDNLRI